MSYLPGFFFCYITLAVIIAVIIGPVRERTWAKVLLILHCISVGTCWLWLPWLAYWCVTTYNWNIDKIQNQPQTLEKP